MIDHWQCSINLKWLALFNKFNIYWCSVIYLILLQLINLKKKPWLFKDPVVIMNEIMSWLFKVPINSGLDQFDHAQSNSKKWPKGYKDQIAPNDFFSRKTTNKIFMYLLAPSILQNLKKNLTADPELWVCAQNGPFVLNKIFWYKPLWLL